MNYRPNSLLVGIVAACAVIVACETDPTVMMTLPPTTTTPATTSSVAPSSPPPPSIDRPVAPSSVAPSPPSTDRTDATTMASDTDTSTADETATDTGSDTSNDVGTATDTDTDPGADNGTGTGTESQDSSATPSGAVAADLVGIDELGMCDGGWVSDLEDTNSDRPPGIDELTESWRCEFGEFDTQVLRWADAAEARDNLMTLKRVTTDAGADPALWQFVLKDDHIIGTATFDQGSAEEVELLTQIQAKIGGEVTKLSELS